jgi:hypothetical protein
MKDKFFIPLSKIKSGAFQVGLTGEEMIPGGGGGEEREGDRVERGSCGGIVLSFGEDK